MSEIFVDFKIRYQKILEMSVMTKHSKKSHDGAFAEHFIVFNVGVLHLKVKIISRPEQSQGLLYKQPCH